MDEDPRGAVDLETARSAASPPPPLSDGESHPDGDPIARFLDGLIADQPALDGQERLARRLCEASGAAGLALVVAEPDGHTLFVAGAHARLAALHHRRLNVAPGTNADLVRRIADETDLDPSDLVSTTVSRVPFCLILVLAPADGEAMRFVNRVGPSVALVLEETRLAERAASERRRDAAAGSIAQAVSQSLDPAHVWPAFASRLTAEIPRAVPALAEVALDAVEGSLHLTLPGDGGGPAEPLRLPHSPGDLLDRAIATRRATYEADLRRSLEPGDQHLVERGFASALAVPLVARQTVTGVLLVGVSADVPLNEDERALVEKAAAHLAPALANAHAYRDLADVHARLEQTARAKDTLSSLLVHDLRNPLTAALVNLDAVSLLERSDPTFDTYIEESRKSLRTAIDLVTNLLDIARLQEGRMPCVRRATALKLLVEAAVQQITPEARRRAVEIETDITAGTFPLDGQIVGRAVRNLVANAVRATEAGGRVSVRSFVANQHLVVEVTDARPALPPERRDELFRKFAPAAAGGLDAHGLGLHFVRLAAEAHGGRAFATASEDGRSRVVFQLFDGR